MKNLATAASAFAAIEELVCEKCVVRAEAVADVVVIVVVLPCEDEQWWWQNEWTWRWGEVTTSGKGL